MGAWSSRWTRDLEIRVVQTDNRKKIYKIDVFFKENSEYLLDYIVFICLSYANNTLSLFNLEIGSTYESSNFVFPSQNWSGYSSSFAFP